jgi:hypothetical protein
MEIETRILASCQEIVDGSKFSVGGDIERKKSPLVFGTTILLGRFGRA